jgi:hypothetical protein
MDLHSARAAVALLGAMFHGSAFHRARNTKPKIETRPEGAAFMTHLLVVILTLLTLLVGTAGAITLHATQGRAAWAPSSSDQGWWFGGANWQTYGAATNLGCCLLDSAFAFTVHGQTLAPQCLSDDPYPCSPQSYLDFSENGWSLLAEAFRWINEADEAYIAGDPPLPGPPDYLAIRSPLRTGLPSFEIRDPSTGPS